jgi:formyltetrahydrofolate synthetase
MPLADIEIAQRAKMLRIVKVAEKLGMREPSLGPVFGMKRGAAGGGEELCRTRSTADVRSN